MPEPAEIYTAERRAQFLLSNAIGADEYAWAREEVQAMGLNPDVIPHYRPIKATDDKEPNLLPFRAHSGQ